MVARATPKSIGPSSSFDAFISASRKTGVKITAVSPPMAGTFGVVTARCGGTNYATFVLHRTGIETVASSPNLPLALITHYRWTEKLWGLEEIEVETVADDGPAPTDPGQYQTIYPFE
jgi:hypothetical protein